jgi:UDP-3-O-[3-hydroxymyristoyl] glucosamine N-acyltransferase
MTYTAGYIAETVGGRVVGAEALEVTGISSPEQVRGGTVLFAKDRKILDGLSPDPTLCVVTTELTESAPSCGAYVLVEEQLLDQAFIRLLSLFQRDDRPRGISPRATVAATATLGADVSVGPGACVGRHAAVGRGTSIGAGAVVGDGCSLGEECVVHPGAVLYPGCEVGDGVIIHAGAVIGSDGFGYARVGGEYRKIPQVGGVRIGSRVEIGAGTTIDRATIGHTVIGRGTKIDNLVQIGHNVTIGENVIICALCGIAGSVRIGDNVVLAGAVGIADHIVIEDDVFIGPKAGVMEKVVKKGSRLIGTPAAEYRDQMSFFAMRHKLRGMYRDLLRIKEKLGL